MPGPQTSTLTQRQQTEYGTSNFPCKCGVQYTLGDHLTNADRGRATLVFVICRPHSHGRRQFNSHRTRTYDEERTMDSDLQASLGSKLAAWCVLYGVAMCFIGLRIFARLHIFGGLTVDDWLMVAAAIAYTFSMITEIFVYLSLTNLDILGYIKSAFALYFVVVLTMWLIKFSVWCFMKRLMHGKWMNRFANAVFVVLVLTFIALNVFNLSWCAPIESVWDLTPSGCVYRIEAIVIFDGVVNTITDILLMILPLPLIWRVRLPVTTKLSLTALFSLGFVVIAANIVSSWIGSQKNFIAGANFTIWCNISLTAAAAVACAPQIRTLFLKRFRQLKSQQQELARNSIFTEDVPSEPADQTTTEKRSKSTPLTLSNKFLRGDGKVGVGDGRLSQNPTSWEQDHELV